VQLFGQPGDRGCHVRTVEAAARHVRLPGELGAEQHHGGVHRQWLGRGGLDAAQPGVVSPVAAGAEHHLAVRIHNHDGDPGGLAPCQRVDGEVSAGCSDDEPG
jgi:hypothetical protein